MTYLIRRILHDQPSSSRFLSVAFVSLVLLTIQATPASAQTPWSTPDPTTGSIYNTNGGGSGKVGIGTTTPASTLEIQSNTDGGIQSTGFGAGIFPALSLRNARGTQAAPTISVSGDGVGDLEFWGYDGAAYRRTAQIRSYVDGTTGSSDMPGSLLFYTQADGAGGSPAERMRINSAGNIGIGTASPAQKLSVNGNIGLSNNSVIFSDADNSNYVKPYETATGRMVFRTGAVDRLSILYSGNVGIGTASPNTKLDVQDTASQIQARSSGVNAGLYLTTVADDNFNISGGSQYTPATSWVARSSAAELISGTVGNLIFFTNTGLTSGYTFLPTERMRINPSGNVGIGTTSPSVKLHVVGDGKYTGSLVVDGNIAAKYQDVAEWVPASAQISAGSVVVLDSTKSNHVISSTSAYDTRVAGVISAQPGITLGESADNKVLVATTGRVKIKVDASRGAIRVGDLLVTSDTAGMAMKSRPLNLSGVQIHRPGTLIGKALEPLARGQGTILVLLSLQ